MAARLSDPLTYSSPSVEELYFFPSLKDVGYEHFKIPKVYTKKVFVYPEGNKIIEKSMIILFIFRYAEKLLTCISFSTLVIVYQRNAKKLAYECFVNN